MEVSLLLYIVIFGISAWTLWFYWKHVAGKALLLSASSWFVVLQALFLVGTIIAVDLDNETDTWWLSLVLGGLVSFVLGARAANYLRKFNPHVETRNFTLNPLIWDLHSPAIVITLFLMGIACLIIGIIFAEAVGYNVFVWALTNYLQSGGEVDSLQYSVMRGSISREEYVAAGYAIQFIGILMPLIIYLIYFRLRRSKNLVELVLFAAIVIADFYFLTISGGRGWLLQALLGFVLLMTALGPLPPRWRPGYKVIFSIVSVFVIFYIISTALMGRVDDTSSTLSWSTGAAAEFYNRMIGSEAQGHLTLMRYFLNYYEPVWGEQWGGSLLSMLPGLKAYGFGNELHGIIYAGNDYGSLGLTIWGSLWYNWGNIGSIVFAFLTGVLIQSFTITYIRGPKVMSRIVILFIAGFHLGEFREPYTLFLNGFVTTICLYILILLVEMVTRTYVRSKGLIPASHLPSLKRT